MYNKFIFKGFIIIWILDTIFWLFFYQYIIPNNIWELVNFNFQYLALPWIISTLMWFAFLKYFNNKEILRNTWLALEWIIVNFDNFTNTSKQMIVKVNNNSGKYFFRYVHNFEYDDTYKWLIEIWNSVTIYVNPKNNNDYFIDLNSIKRSLDI